MLEMAIRCIIALQSTKDVIGSFNKLIECICVLHKTDTFFVHNTKTTVFHLCVQDTAFVNILFLHLLIVFLNTVLRFYIPS